MTRRGALVQRPHQGGQTDAARTDDEHVVARADLGAVHAVQSDGEWFHQRRVGRGDVRGECEAVASGNGRVLGESARWAHPDVARLWAVRYQACSAILAAITRNHRQHSDIGAFPPAVGIRTRWRRLTAEFVAHDHPGAA